MAVAKMEFINIIGHMDSLEDVAKKIVLSQAIHPVNAMTEISENHFPIMRAKDEVDALIDYNYIRQYQSNLDLSEIRKIYDELCAIFDIKKRYKKNVVEEEYVFLDDLNRIEQIYEEVKEEISILNSLENEYREIEELENYMSYIKNVNVNFGDLFNMKFIKFIMGKVSNYNMEKLKNNYENIPAIVLKLDKNQESTKIMIFMPKMVELEVRRVLSSLEFEEFNVNFKFHGSPNEWIKEIKARKKEIEKELVIRKNKLKEIKQEHINFIDVFYSKLLMQIKIEELKSQMGCTNEFFYMSGWIPRFRKKTLSKYLGDLESKLIIIYKQDDELREGLEPPTYIFNGFLLRPFESVVKLYGVPSYKELDPTAFVGLSYMFLFGAMFGDVGQGLVLLLLGLLLEKKKRRPNLGGVLARLGISSTLFGFLYGSVFGFEDIIDAVLVRPMASIDKVLIWAVGIGVFLLSVGFLYNLVNCFIKKDIENGIFSRNGLAGLIFYWLLLYLVVATVRGVETIVPRSLITVLLILLLVLMLLKEPLSNLIKGIKPLYSESKADYYIEGGFGVLETLLSMLSNTLSFIRVGAFAINHVGLFIAFETLAEMMGNHFESILMIIFGNVVIIGLEGLIVFIQGLRLEYYELFSKFFSGTGYEYNPIKL
ncbi:V-type ATP synthase subunit I [Thermobrachium celere]|uniref:V-type ATP synthase subunit I n=1 Tax=Thermobrachium celere DSM 8682 TaxID=941824 RepID=R7RQW8_9CLOT|nr:V-type ATPase 116kDa subunit family protein [Thermobrachium celere]CDF58582.1 V-type ATP synthase subunit I [Thermobrachium celere DSM 8682]